MTEGCPARIHTTAYAHRQLGCVCPESRAAVAGEKAAYRRRLYLERRDRTLVDVTGTRRRVQALVRMGWTLRLISAECGWEWLGPLDGILYRTTRVHVDTAERVKRAYDVMSMRPGPSAVSAHRAALKGWPPPFAWEDDTIDDRRTRPLTAPRPIAGDVDEVAVLEAMAGREVRLTKAEKREVARRLSAAGLTASEIAERMHASRAAAQKMVSRARKVAA